MLEALKEIDLLELIERQKMLDDKFNEKNKNNKNLKKRNKVNTLIALGTELGETNQEGKEHWCYWKNNCEFHKDRFLEELSDYLHFLLQHTYSIDSIYEDIKENNVEYNLLLNKNIEIYSNKKEKPEGANIENSLFYLYTPIAFELCGIEFSSLYVRGIFNAITSILYEIDSNWIEFLKIHHKKFELNYYERTKEDY